VHQAYLVDAEECLEELVDWARATERTSPLTVRLVKGAYWDIETVEARQMGWRSPAYATKAETDRCLETLTLRLLDARPVVRVAIASHNSLSVGDLLAVECVADLDEACAVVEGLPVALTSGLFARDPAVVHRIARRLPVGNLYVNRHITGAMVGRQPFGGNRLSGTGTKAGGPGYLEHFVEPRVVTENTLRHGLAV
jgi:hypothetical protein